MAGTVTAGEPFTLTGTVEPQNATNKTIAWSVKNAGTTGANISGNTLTTTSGGIVTVTAVIANGTAEDADYTQDFNITVVTTLSNLSELAVYLAKDPLNTADNPIPVKVDINLANDWGELLNILNMASRHVYLDISDSDGMTAFNTGAAAAGKGFIVTLILPRTVIGIPSNAFSDFTSLREIRGANVAMLESRALYNVADLRTAVFPVLASIGDEAFSGCANLSSVTLGTIPSANFSVAFPFPGDLREVYFALPENLRAGTYFTLSPGSNPTWKTDRDQTPVANDFDIGNLDQSLGDIRVTITPKAGKSPGVITIYYNGSTTIPATAGTYIVTFDVAAAPAWNAATGLFAGTLTINQIATPVAGDFDIGNLTQNEWNVTPVTIEAKTGKSPGVITIFYNGSTTLPTAAGTYTVTFNVASAAGWNEATDLFAGTLTIMGLCEACGQQVCITEPPELPYYYTNPTARWKKSDDAIWLGCYEAVSNIQFRWVIDSETKARIRTGEINRFLLYLDADKIDANTFPPGRVDRVSLAVVATRKDGSLTWRQMSGSFNYPTVAGGVTGNTIISQGEPLVFFLNHSDGWDLIDWGEESMFQLYVQNTASSGFIEGLHFISGYLDKAEHDDPAACDGCGKLLCECLPTFPYQLPSEYTWRNTESQLGYGFSVRWGDPSFTALAASRYMVFEVESDNAAAVPQFRLVFLGAGQLSHANNMIIAGETLFANAVGSTYYVVVELEKILETNGLPNDAVGTAWEKIKEGTSARFLMQDGWPARVQRTFLLDALPGTGPTDKVDLLPGIRNEFDRNLPAFVTTQRDALGIPAP